MSEAEGLTKVYTLPDKLEQELKSQADYWERIIQVSHPGNNDRLIGYLSKDITQDLDANGYRLPTEAEWEFAAKGNQSFSYSGSNDPNEVAWHLQNSNSQTHSVGQKKANGFGLHDMSGNVYEWCWDWYGDHENYNTWKTKELKSLLLRLELDIPKKKKDMIDILNNHGRYDPTGPSTGVGEKILGRRRKAARNPAVPFRVYRGGCNCANTFISRVSFRISASRWRSPLSRSPWQGLRVSRTIQKKKRFERGLV
jgi:formylglycine-generating enzyme required for sulfatase activity